MIRSLLGAHIPWSQVEVHLERILEMGLVPEIAIKGPELDEINPQTLQWTSRQVAECNMRPKVHAPFFDLNPGALDPVIRQATKHRLQQALSFAGDINSNLMILHPGVDKWRYPNLSQAWLDNAVDFFADFITSAEQVGCRLVIENIYEDSPDILIQLVNRLDSEWFGHCFDAGHWHLFGRRPLGEWLEAISSRLYHMHLHDNHGRADEHLPVGAGTIDFMPLRKHLHNMVLSPSITLEAHKAEHLVESLQNVRKLLA